MNNKPYSATIDEFTKTDALTISGWLNQAGGDRRHNQQRAWNKQIVIMQDVLSPYCGRGKVYFEWEIPRLGGRIDVLVLIDNVVFVIEFKVGERTFRSTDREQVSDYALDLKNFHAGSHDALVAPILVATESAPRELVVEATDWDASLLVPLPANKNTLGKAIERVLDHANGYPVLKIDDWERSGYKPTPTIVEVAKALYADHSVEEITHSEARGYNLRVTSTIIERIIKDAKTNSHKVICFVTGVPGSGKTLVGMNLSISPEKRDGGERVFLSGNGPLVGVLQEALKRDKLRRDQESGLKIKRVKAQDRSAIKRMVQQAPKFRDNYTIRESGPPPEHVAIFDEAQRAWDIEELTNFMSNCRGIEQFDQSEPEFFISCLNRHDDWAVIVCLVGGGQEINRGEAGISEWLSAINSDAFSDWHVYLPSQLNDSEYKAEKELASLKMRQNVFAEEGLHLSTSMRSFRAENVSLLVKQLLDRDREGSRRTLRKMKRYPIKLTRDVEQAKRWIKKKADDRGSERYGLMVSSQARRLRRHAIDVRPRINPVYWFLNGKDDVRSSYYLEEVATEFEVQGLELDWGLIIWDADLRYSHGSDWLYRSFKGNEWVEVDDEDRRKYLKNAYRVLLTRARQGMVIVVPEGDPEDPTRDSEFYDPTYEYLESIGFEPL